MKEAKMTQVSSPPPVFQDRTISLRTDPKTRDSVVEVSDASGTVLKFPDVKSPEPVFDIKA
jgi:hypothetical protein